MAADNVLKFFPFSSMVDATFWHVLSEKKLNELKLDERALPITAVYRNDSSASGLSPLITVDYDSFENNQFESVNHTLHGDVFVTNTLEEFKAKDKQQILDDIGQQMWTSINSNEDINPSKTLNRFVLLTYLDLKKFHFYYWFAFPSIVPKKVRTTSSPKYLKDIMNEQSRRSVEDQYYKLASDQKSYFLVHHSTETNNCTLHSILEFDKIKESVGKVFLGFADPSSSKDYAGWPLRNALAFLSARYKTQKSWTVIGLRLTAKSCDFSIVLDVELDEGDGTEATGDLSTLKVVGWEKNEKQKLLPRFVDMSAILDPSKLAENAVNLNLKLMRWRLVPELDLDIIAQTKCLLLGAGTLGCNVARALIGWGVQTITFVDNSKVSFSNPVRQSLFNFEDCLNGGKPKAQAAAEALKRIYPKINSTGIQMSIPMPGHFVPENLHEATKAVVEALDKLIQEHDCVFLLMDTRESRWLPTVIAQACNKLCINAALGFDTFLVQRHGVRMLQSAENTSKLSDTIFGRNLGCYFCNDVVAPGNSTRDRTLDQQCTVTRPGISMMAGALAAELMVSAINHPLGTDAPAPGSGEDDTGDSEMCLGIVPHQIRGFLSQFKEVLPSTSAFQFCTACSTIVIDSYRTESFDFLVKAFNDPTFLEELTGLKKLHDETNMQDVWALSDDDQVSESSLT